MKKEKFCTWQFALCVSTERGFSLVELLAVLLLLSLASFIVLPSVDRGLRERQVRKSALELAALARDLRGRAIYESNLQRLIFNPLENSYQAVRGRKVVLSSDVKITRIKGGEPLGEGLRQFIFYPNGTVLSGEIGISARQGFPSYWIRFDALTGRVGVIEGGRE
jgi:general secretion pathway protein H